MGEHSVIHAYAKHINNENPANNDEEEEDDENITDACDDDENMLSDRFLIQMVKKFPILYNKKIKTTSLNIEHTWDFIAQQLNSTAKLCSNRWIRLKQYFCKERYRRETNDKSLKSWPLYDEMLFMDKFIYKRTRKIKAMNPCKIQKNQGSTITSVHDSSSNYVPSVNIEEEIIYDPVNDEIQEAQTSQDLIFDEQPLLNKRCTNNPHSSNDGQPLHSVNQSSNRNEQPLINNNSVDQSSNGNEQPLINGNSVDQSSNKDLLQFPTDIQQKSLTDGHFKSISNQLHEFDAVNKILKAGKENLNKENKALAQMIIANLGEMKNENDKRKLKKKIMNIIYE